MILDGWPQRWVLDDCGACRKIPGSQLVTVVSSFFMEGKPPSSTFIKSTYSETFFLAGLKKDVFFFVFLFGRKPSNSFFFWILHGEDLGRMQIKIYDIYDLFLIIRWFPMKNEDLCYSPYTKIFHPSPTSTNHREESNFLKKGLLKFRVSRF